MNLRRTPEPSELEARLTARFVSKVRAALAERAEALPHDVTERLRVAREQAVARAREVRLAQDKRRAAGAPVAVGAAGGVALLAQPAPFWQRAASFAPLVLLVLGLFLIQHGAELEQVHAAAEVDAQLLKDVLPPDAYSDPGFAEFLRRSEP
jgi:hypothetical protein